MNILLLKNFNNYFNRTVKKYSEIETYMENAKDYYIYSEINFNPNDGVSTELIIGGPTQVLNDGTPIKWDIEGTPDYAIIFEETNIISRWFIIDSERTRNGQYKVFLKRDTFADHLNELIKAPVFIEKGTIIDADNPLLFNNENMTYNQIKKNEYLLQDETKTPWIVGYVAKNAPAEDTKVSASFSNTVSGALLPSDLPWYSSATFDVNKSETIYDSYDIKIKTSFGTINHDGPTRAYGYNITMNYTLPDDVLVYKNHSTVSNNNANIANIPYVYLGTDNDANSLTAANNNIVNKLKNLPLNIQNSINAALVNRYGVNYGSDITEYRDTIINTPGGFYRVNMTKTAFPEIKFNSNLSSSTLSEIREYARPEGYSNNKEIEIYTKPYVYIVTYTLLQSGKISTTIGRGGDLPNRGYINDSLFDMFVIPYDKLLNVRYPNSDWAGRGFYIKPEASRAIARAISSTLTDSVIYDLQVLPYCPIENVRKAFSKGYLDLNQIKDTDFEYIVEEEQIYPPDTPESEKDPIGAVSVLFWANSASGSFNIPLSISVPDNALDLKILNETTVSRLCSPNYSGIFEFSIAKNKGIDYFNVDYDYRPYNPYIHINPNFKELYGQDWDDARGLILGGDFTFSAVGDAWQNYQLQNKNFQNIFDRQIQNMDVNNAIAIEQQNWNAVAGTVQAMVTGAASGAMGGAMLGGGIGAGIGVAAGGISAGVLSGVGAAKDKEWLLRSQSEGKDYAVDMYGYSLGNIQALPYSISKTDAITKNNKLWPFLEIYDCTDTEKAALRNKLIYDGMTIMTINTVNDFLDASSNQRILIRGNLIRVDDFTDDSHILTDAYSELKKGLYFESSELGG